MVEVALVGDHVTGLARRPNQGACEGHAVDRIDIGVLEERGLREAKEHQQCRGDARAAWQAKCVRFKPKGCMESARR